MNIKKKKKKKKKKKIVATLQNFQAFTKSVATFAFNALFSDSGSSVYLGVLVIYCNNIL